MLLGKIVVPLFLLICTPFVLLAQEAGIVGTVTDQSGAVVSQATVTVTNQGTGESHQTNTNNVGQYRIPNLEVGSYEVVIDKAGFRRGVVERVRLEVQLISRVDFTLQLGETTNEVRVTANPGSLETEQSAIGTLLDNKMVTETPLNGRNFLQLQTLLPGVTPGRNGFFSAVKIDAQTTDIGGGAFSVNGQKPIYNDFLLDGVSFQEWENNTNAFNPSIDAIEEFRTQGSNYSAEFGINAGGLVNMVMKSGTNRFHGSAYEFIRNDKLDAANYFTNFFGQPKPPLRRNQFGGTLGGPIVRDKTFFFASYEGFREARAQTLSGTYPTAAMRTGDFSELLNLPSPITISDPVTGVPFPGNIIPSNRILSFWPAFLSKYIPLPNRPGLDQNYVIAQTHHNDINQGMARVDHRLSGKLSLDGHYVYNQVTDLPVSLNPTFGSSQNSRAHNVMLHAAYVHSPNTIIDFRAGYLRFWQDLKGNLEGTSPYIARDVMGIHGIPNDSRSSDAPFFSVAGFDALGSSNISLPRKWINERYEYRFSVYSHHNQHDLSYGLTATRLHNTFQERIIPNGLYFFNGIFSGYAMSDMLLGIPNTWIGAPDEFDPNFRAWSFSPWVQDDWRVTTNLTLNIGLRYEWIGHPYSANDEISNVRLPPGGGLATVVMPGQCIPELPSHQCYLGGLTVNKPATRSTLANNNKNFAPRIGFAYRLGDRTVVRSAYGIFFQKEFMGRSTILATNPPFVGAFTVNNTPETFQNFSFTDPYAGLSQGGKLGFEYIPEHTPNAYLQSWNLAVQRALGAGINVEVAYVGNKGTHQEANTVPNQPRLPGPGDLDSRRPYTNVSGIAGEESIGNSSYNGLQIKAEKRFSNGLSFLSSYTWSKAFASGCDFQFTVTPGGGCVSNQYDPQSARGLDQNDQRHRFTLSWLYALPLGKGRFFLSNASGAVGKIVSDWQLGGIVAAASGQPLTPILTFDNPNVGAQIALPDVVSNPNKGPKTIEEWFDTSAFQTPAPFTFGSARVASITGPGSVNVDFSIFKSIPISESLKLQFRSEFFNLLNHTNLGDPNTTFGTPQFGKIFGAGPSREIQFSLRLEF
ncbi:MAG TPA: TonB-dependent receptor [Terriglobales bacterium]|nr:TonB-dependent receptor [Terriglobales bacterium]